MLSIDQINLDVQYSKAKASFERSIADPADNEDIKDEIDIPISEIITKIGSVRITFYESEKSHYMIETFLLLFTPSGEKIGYYSLDENENEEVIDTFLVFE